MQNPLVALSLVLATVSTAAAGWAIVENQRLRVQLEERALLPSAQGADALTGPADGVSPLPPAEVAQRLAAMQQQMQQVASAVRVQERQVESLTARVEVHEAAPPIPADLEAAPVESGVEATADSPEARARQAALLKQLVAKEVQAAKIKEEKKPSLDRFAKHLQLTDVQKDGVVREVVRAQREMMDLLKVPTQDGTVFLDQLVDVFVTAAGDQSKAGPKMMQLFARISTEKIPGTDATYLSRIEGIKSGVKDTLRRDLTREQYAAYEQMAVSEDPTELQNVPGSPWQELMQKVAEKLPEEQRQAFEEQQGK